LSEACNLAIDEGGVRGVRSVQIETKLCQTLGL
jgi:hypothetical protein